MQLEILSFCDAAAEYSGRLNIIGATDTLNAHKLPLKYPSCCIVMRFRVARIEQGEHTVRVMIIDEDAHPLLNLDGKMNIQIKSGLTGAINVLINTHNLEFKEAGEYALEVAVDGIQMGSCPLFVRNVIDEAVEKRIREEQATKDLDKDIESEIEDLL